MVVRRDETSVCITNTVKTKPLYVYHAARVSPRAIFLFATKKKKKRICVHFALWTSTPGRVLPIDPRPPPPSPILFSATFGGLREMYPRSTRFFHPPIRVSSRCASTVEIDRRRRDSRTLASLLAPIFYTAKLSTIGCRAKNKNRAYRA